MKVKQRKPRWIQSVFLSISIPFQLMLSEHFLKLRGVCINGRLVIGEWCREIAFSSGYCYSDYV